MKRFLVFAGSHYYPSGGFDDFMTDVDQFEQARQYGLGYLKAEQSGWAHVFDVEIRKIVWKAEINYNDKIEEHIL